MRITLISDTHTKHNLITDDLTGGDLLLHSGDISSGGTNREIEIFVQWYDSIENYKNKIFIAGNHDWGFQLRKQDQLDLLRNYRVKYLQDESTNIDGVNIYGSPWQPEFYDWAFNLERNGKELEEVWNNIPDNTDILIVHGPAFGYLDDVENNRGVHLGCELLNKRIKEIKPKIVVCGHIHSGHGYTYDGNTHYFNASVLNEQYLYGYLPFNIEWNPITNEIEFI